MLSVGLQYDAVPERFKFRRDPVFDVVAGKKYFDMRRLLILRFLRLNDKPPVKKWLKDARTRMLAHDVSAYDKALAMRLLA